MNTHNYKIERVPNEAWIRMLEAGIRTIILRAGTVIDLQKSVTAILGDEAAAILYEAGIRAGKGSTKVLLEEWTEQGMTFLRRWGEFYRSAGVGWFKLEDIQVDFRSQTGSLRIKQSFIAEEYGPSDRSVCHFLCGFFVGVLEEVLRAKLLCEEVTCLAKGDPDCTFRFEPV